MSDHKRNRKSKYGEATQVMRIPFSLVPEVEKMLREREVLETTWTASAILPPLAQRIVDAIVEQLMVPQISLVEVLEEQGDIAFKAMGQELRKQLQGDRQRMKDRSSQLILGVLKDELT